MKHIFKFTVLLMVLFLLPMSMDAKEADKSKQEKTKKSTDKKSSNKKSSEKKKQASKEKAKPKPISMEQLQDAYKANLRNLIEKYKGKRAYYKGEVTSVGSLSGEGNYQIGLDGARGRFIVSPMSIPESIHKRLAARQGKDAGKMMIEFSGVWYANEGNTFYFQNLKDVTLTSSAPPKKKPQAKKKTNKKKKSNKKKK